MTTIPVLLACRYLTEVEGLTWRDKDYAARNIVRAVKEQPFKGYSDIKMGAKIYRLMQSTGEDFVMCLTRAMGRKLSATLGAEQKISIVPIPNSAAVASSTAACRIDNLANYVAAGFGANAIVEPVIRWKAARNPQHKESGYRHPDLFQDQMTLLGTPKNPVVLFDDVMTSGSQMTAAARLLQDAGHLPIQALVVGRVTSTQEDKMLGWGFETLPIGREIIDASDIDS
jgi:hypothetical protein